ncbi:Chromodomain-helicase-DNA-binding protein 1-like [Sciurus carolinensis]|uniref:Chromodomain-helicase-DNA-binding protein 1-like n=1 Tax=Sciurus carolinensis TaxID=30640 RepID=A0AA41MU23_SCICA|nr:Chromodomain-helicase-DNA-binding protein 1-like [Sciurus carolinensis]
MAPWERLAQSTRAVGPRDAWRVDSLEDTGFGATGPMQLSLWLPHEASDLFVCCCSSLCNGYSYEHVDGSLRGEERHLAIKNFGQQPSIIFLLNTREGGIGMNLTAADTVIFVDSDFNPQNDLQAAFRAHQIGQNKRVS